MADFTEDEKAAIRTYLGFSALYREIDPRLESQIGPGGLGTTQPASAARVRAILSALVDIELRLTGALDNLDLVKAEDITFLGPAQLDALRGQGRMLVGQLAIIFEVAPKADYFAVDGGGGMGGVIPLG